MGKESIKRVEEQIKGKVRLKVMDISELKEDIKDILFPGIWTRIYGLASKIMG